MIFWVKATLKSVNLLTNLFTPFPFGSTDDSSSDTLHHKSRCTSTGTRTSFHDSLATKFNYNTKKLKIAILPPWTNTEKYRHLRPMSKHIVPIFENEI